jgi:hypothetical protein
MPDRLLHILPQLQSVTFHNNRIEWLDELDFVGLHRMPQIGIKGNPLCISFAVYESSARYIRRVLDAQCGEVCRRTGDFKEEMIKAVITRQLTSMN